MAFHRSRVPEKGILIDAAEVDQLGQGHAGDDGRRAAPQAPGYRDGVIACDAQRPGFPTVRPAGLLIGAGNEVLTTIVQEVGTFPLGDHGPFVGWRSCGLETQVQRQSEDIVTGSEVG